MTVRCQIALGASEKCVGQPGYSGFPWGAATGGGFERAAELAAYIP